MKKWIPALSILFLVQPLTNGATWPSINALDQPSVAHADVQAVNRAADANTYSDSNPKTYSDSDLDYNTDSFPTPTATPTPTANLSATPDIPGETGDGIASRYPNDVGIGSDPSVLLFDDFESYTAGAAASQLSNGRWDSAYHPNLKIATSDVNAGNKSLEMTLPVTTSQISNTIVKNISPTQDVLHIRCYTKFDPGFMVQGTQHNGMRLSAKYPGPGGGTPANGTGWFLFNVQNAQDRAGELPPGVIDIYAYWPRRRSGYGDHLHPAGFVAPGGDGDWMRYPAQYPDWKPYPDSCRCADGGIATS